MPFGNPILGGGGTLIRRAIHSPDYVPGVSGWSINKDGTVEFNDGVFRGDVTVNSLVAGTPGGERIEITSAGEMLVFNSSNEQIASITATSGYRVQSTDGSYAELTLSPVNEVAALLLNPPTDPDVTITRAAQILAGIGLADAFLSLFSPQIDSGLTASIRLYGEDSVAPDAIYFDATESNFLSTIVNISEELALNGEVTLVVPSVDPCVPVRAFSSQNPTWTGAITYTNAPGGGGNLFGTTFVAPPSGTVMITAEAWIGTGSTTMGRRSYLSFEVRTGSTIGSGTLAGTAANDDRAGMYNNVTTGAGFKYGYVSVKDMYTGLTPGDTYNVTSLVRIDNAADTGAVNKRKFIVEPSLVAG